MPLQPLAFFAMALNDGEFLFDILLKIKANIYKRIDVDVIKGTNVKLFY